MGRPAWAVPTVDLGKLNPKQKEFCQARNRYVAYGGARGGGKTHVLIRKAVGGALTYENLRILIVRREYPELEQSIILPMRRLIPATVANYNGTMRMFTFVNGSIIKGAKRTHPNTYRVAAISAFDA